MSDVKYAIRYFSREGSTKKLADAISEQIGVEAFDVSEPIIDKVDVLFIGGAVYRKDIDMELRSFINSLDAGVIGEAVIFSISSGNKHPYDVMSELFTELGIPVNEKFYFCKGKTLFGNGGHPDLDDLKAVKIFAKGIVSSKE